MSSRQHFSSRMPQLAETELLILTLLQEGEQFPLRLADRSGGSLKRGTVYITLQRMQNKGYVESQVEPAIAGATGRPRAHEGITGKSGENPARSRHCE